LFLLESYLRIARTGPLLTGVDGLEESQGYRYEIDEGGSFWVMRGGVCVCWCTMGAEVVGLRGCLLFRRRGRHGGDREPEPKA